jgi:hypothetical protein
VERWEQASAANDAFALGVPWKPAALTVGEIMDCLFEEHQQFAAARTLRTARRKKAVGLVSRFLNFIAKG